MEEIVAHSLEELYTEFERTDWMLLESGLKDMVPMKRGLRQWNTCRRCMTAWLRCLCETKSISFNAIILEDC